ncbi:MAG TPA: hypothetical protein DD376_00450 [Sutterella sp.]|nr:hypothetical protein [Sutterella sp.]
MHFFGLHREAFLVCRSSFSSHGNCLRECFCSNTSDI